MFVCPYVRPSTKSVFDFNEVRHVGRGRWMMHDSVQYDLIQSQGHEPFKVGNLAIFKSCLLRYLQRRLATDHWFWNYGTVSKFDWAEFLKFVLVFVSRDFVKLAQTSVAKSRPSVPYRANFLYWNCHMWLCGWPVLGTGINWQVPLSREPSGGWSKGEASGVFPWLGFSAFSFLKI